MTLDLDKPVQTKDGRPARIVSRDAKGDKPLVVLVTNHAGEHRAFGWAGFYRLDGRYDECEPTLLDLVNVPEPAPEPAFGDTPEAKAAVKALAAFVPKELLDETASCVNYVLSKFLTSPNEVMERRRKIYYLMKQALLTQKEA